MRRYSSLVAVVSLLSLGIVAQAQPPVKKPVPKPIPKPNQVKGQGQLMGGNGQFGVTYTLTSKFNFALLNARYSLEPVIAYNADLVATDKKVFVVGISMKNANPEENYFNGECPMTLVDQTGQLYTSGTISLKSQGSKEVNTSLKPGQGIGQPGLNDPLEYSFLLPAKARIVKIIYNHPRLNQKEEVFRYYLAGATKAEAGEAGDPKNAVTPLPAEVRDPADPTGTTPLEEAPGKIGQAMVSGWFSLRLDGFAYSTESFGDHPPGDGKQWAIATVTAKYLADKTLTMFDVLGGDFALYEVTDADGERYKPVNYLKAKRYEDAEHEFRPGDEYTFRIVFELPKDTTAKKLVLGTGNAHKWAIDVSSTRN